MRNLSEEEKEAIILRVMADEAQLGMELKIRFARETISRNETEMNEQRRTAGESSRLQGLTEDKGRQAAERAAAEKARKEKETAAARDEYLSRLAGRENEIWLKIESLISTKQPGKYDEAVKLLVDLRDFAERSGKMEGFFSLYRELCGRHEKKPSLLRKIQKEL